MGLLDEAICAFQTAVTQNPNSAEAYYNLGYAYRCKGLHSEAIPVYQKSLELISENKAKQKASIHYNLGFSYFSNGLIDDAIGEFKKALAYKPKDKEIHQKLGIAYTAKGWTDKAKDEFSLYHEHDKSAKKIP
jgi:tetratricopeptide (TPR) repeat protein